ncbi:DUF72 domain-containing protein [Roseivirga sp. BDSF3-8]|uniref:DUF72 domain-containing protein n=1 Tax=Roseivirga sp. BDSF3-8 TaxID=3241598 RepID=UPI00353277E5
MKFGRLENIEEVDWHLPETHPATPDILRQQGAAPVTYYIGCSVWSVKGYVGKVFPPRTPGSKYLQAYGKQFYTVEANSTHYNIPTLDTIHKWRDSVQDGFKFCPKFPQFISHRRQMVGNPEAIDRFLRHILALGDKLGTSFLQLPPYFSGDRADDLIQLLEYLPRDFKLALEFRHPQWFQDTTLMDDMFSYLTERHISAVISDVAGRRDVLHQRLTTPLLFLRFNGHNLHPTDYSRIDAWVKRISQWVEEGLKEVYIFVHEPEQHLNADLALYLIESLNKQCDAEIPVPHWYENQQTSLFS